MEEKMAGWKNSQLLVAILVLPLLQTQAIAINKSYIVYLGGHSHGSEATSVDYERATNSHNEFLSSFFGSKEKAQNAIFHSYTHSINAFAAVLEEEEARQLREDPNVVSVFENKQVKLHTTRSWDFLDLVADDKIPSSSIWAKARFGEDSIIANIDTGVWPESKSFSDEGMGPVPSRWRGYCQNDTKEGVPCNKKLIGARYLNVRAPYEPQPPNSTSLSTRDDDGHGTHTLSTAGGRFVPGANIFGHANGTAKGGSPHARVAAYKVCWFGGFCSAADILAAFDAAIHDGADVISVSLGDSFASFLQDPIGVGAFHAVMNGITVVCSAGNDGPMYGSLSNAAPWIITVGASTVDRRFPALLILGNKKQIWGESLSTEILPKNKFYPLITANESKADNASADLAQYCSMGTLDPKKVKGKIVVCDLGFDSSEVRRGGGVGMVQVNPSYADSTDAYAWSIPTTNIRYADSSDLYSYISSTKEPVASILAPKDENGVKPAPAVAIFSSRGPNNFLPQIIKPDITAPGVEILAAYSEGATPFEENDSRRVKYILMSGTSMSCPHVAGVAGLLKTLYPDWSPSRIRSAIMTTARTRDNTGSTMTHPDVKKPTPFEFGSGEIWPNRAMDPGLVYDVTIDNYLDLVCAYGFNSSKIAMLYKKHHKCPSKPMKIEDLNYPSIAAPHLNETMVITRTLTNVGSPGTYRARVKAPVGIFVSVKPNTLKFSKVGEKKDFQVYFKPHKSNIGGQYVFGELVWSDEKHSVRSPLAVRTIS